MKYTHIQHHFHSLQHKNTIHSGLNKHFKSLNFVFNMNKTEANIKFGNRIRSLRLSRGFSQEELAFNCGLDKNYIGYIERGEKSATINTIQKLANGLKVNLKFLFDYE